MHERLRFEKGLVECKADNRPKDIQVSLRRKKASC